MGAPVIAASVSQAVAAQLRDLVAQLDAAAARAEAAAKEATGNALTRAFQSLAGTDSSSAAARSLAASQRGLAVAVRAKAAKLQTDAAALALLREAASSHWADVGDVEALARSLTVGGAAKTVAVASAKDAAQLAVDVGQGAMGALRLAPLALLVVGAFVLFTWGRRPGA